MSNSTLTSPPQTALHWAALNGDERFIEMLFERGADISAKNVTLFFFWRQERGVVVVSSFCVGRWEDGKREKEVFF